jgi:sugar phosphate isomerase/epimerase
MTMDTGHMMFRDGAGFRPFGTLGGLVRHIGQKLFHVHVHDYDGQHDHIAIGAGKIDFPELIGALVETGYPGVLCLELNAGRVSPEAMLASRGVLKEMLREANAGRKG